jgi:hypothetical protein
MPAGVPVQVRLADDEISALDNYRREKLNPPSRSRALRELARQALRERSVESPVQSSTMSGHALQTVLTR